jgi:60 kDa SS-A/Ro ribonucleoprotein
MSYKAYKLQDAKQTQQAHPNQVPNNAGGFVWELDDWARLNRFLVLGTEGGTYYVAQRPLTLNNASVVTRCVKADGVRTVNQITKISVEGRAPKNDAALFSLAVAIKCGDEETRKAAYAAIEYVVRIPTHMFHLMEYLKGVNKGWSRGLRKAVSRWYEKSPETTAYHAIKYRQRDGWTQADLLRLAHPVAISDEHNQIFNWITKGWEDVGPDPHPSPALVQIWAFERVQRVTSVEEAVSLIRDYNLPREAIPTQWLTNREIWEALLVNMPMTAMIRNLSVMTNVGLIAPMSDATNQIVTKLANAEAIKRARVHPLSVLVALNAYKENKNASPKIIDALNDAFYLAFGAVEPSNKRMLLALDVSGSMTSPDIAGMKGVSPRVGSMAMALITAAVERNHEFLAFSSSGGSWGRSGVVKINISPKQRLDDVINQTDRLPFGGTNCALPMIWAQENQVPVDTFVIYTDNETWAGSIHPHVALQNYRQKTGIPSKLVVVGMTSTGFSIANPDDSGMLDVVGFDTATPQVISNF